jgi:hypothetical protein
VIIVEDHPGDVFEVFDIPLVVHVATGEKDLSNACNLLSGSSAAVG